MQRRNKKLSRKGTLGLMDVPNIILSMILIVVLGVSIYLILGGLNTSLPRSNNGNSSAPGGTFQENASFGAIGNMTASMNNIISYAPTWGTIIGVAVLIGIVLGAFYFGSRGFGGAGGAE